VTTRVLAVLRRTVYREESCLTGRKAMHVGAPCGTHGSALCLSQFLF
jgi:hypothetical protein